MKKYQIITDGSCDLSETQLKENDIVNIPFYVSFDKINSLKEGIDISKADFYQKEVDSKNVFPTSSCPAPQDFYLEFEKSVKNNLAVICICITKKFSSSYNSAEIAKKMILENYPNAKIEIVDSRVNTVLQGLFVLETARMQRAGMKYDELIKELKNKQGSRIFFTVSNLDYLVHGGRLGKLSGFLGKLFQVNPIIVLKHGEIYSGGIAIQRKRAELNIIRKVQSYFKSNNLKINEYRFVIGYGYDINEASKFKEMCERELKTNVELSQIGATIAVHTGPNPLGIAFVKKFKFAKEKAPKGKIALKLATAR